MEESIVYFASCDDLFDIQWTKIGSCGNWVERSSTYKTSYPLCNIKPYCIIQTSRHTLVETIFKKEYEFFSSIKHKKYVNGGTEWITKKLTIEEIQQVLHKHPTIKYNLLSKDSLDKFLREAERKARSREEKDKKSDIEYEEYIALCEKQQKKHYPLKLRGYQVEAYEKIQRILTFGEYFSHVLKLYIMCRCGKTILFQKIAFDYFDCFDIIVYICPRLNLIKDMISRWNGIFPNIHMAELSSSNSKHCISDDGLKSICLKKDKTILFVCNDSFHRLKPLLDTDMKKMFVFDEAHYLAQKKTDKHPLLLLKQNKGPSLTIFATATPVIGNYIVNTNHIFMNDPEYFGDDNIIKYNDIEDAIKNKFMTPASIVVGAYDLSEGRIEPKEYNVRWVKSVTMLWDLLTADLEYKPKKILMYANSIKSVNSMFQLLKEDSRFEKTCIFKMTSKEDFKTNAASLKQFKESPKMSILINCRMVTDGIDIPELDTIVFIDPRYNKADLIQIISRPRSYCVDRPNKLAYILIPQIYDCMNECETGGDGFETVINIIEELHINNDPTVVKYIHNISYGNKDETKKHNHNVPRLHLDEKVKAKILELTKERLLKKPLSLPQAILKVLSDNQPRTSTQIWEEIENGKLWTPSGKTPWSTCQARCGDLFRLGKVSRQKVDGVFMYFNTRILRRIISTDEFIKRLRSMDIETESQYRDAFQGCYNSDCPEIPSDIYKEFEWSMLSSGKKYSLDECKVAIQKLQPTVLKLIENQYKTDQEVNDILSRLDKMIPSDIKKEYGIEPSTINEKLFGSFDDF